MFLMELGTEKHLTMDNMIICCLDLFLAGYSHQYNTNTDFLIFEYQNFLIGLRSSSKFIVYIAGQYLLMRSTLGFWICGIYTVKLMQQKMTVFSLFF